MGRLVRQPCQLERIAEALRIAWTRPNDGEVASLERLVHARNTLLISGACRLPAVDELPACELRSDGGGRRRIVIEGRRVSPPYFIGVEDDQLERQLAAYRSSLVCR